MIREKMRKGMKPAVVAVLGAAAAIGLFFGGKTAVEAFQASQAQKKHEKYLSTVSAPYVESDAILPNVYVEDVPIGTLSRAEAAAALRTEMLAQNVHTITVHLPASDLTFSTELENLEADIDNVLDTACAIGRDAQDVEELVSNIEAAEEKRTDISFSTEVSWDADSVRDIIHTAAEEQYVEPIQSQVELNGDDLYIGICKGTSGWYLDEDALSEAVLEAFEEEDYSDISFALTEIPVDPVPISEYYYKYTWKPRTAYYDPETESVKDERVGYSPEIPEEEAIAAVEALAPGESVILPFSVVEPAYNAETLRSMLFRDTLASYGSYYESNWGRTENLRLACEAINGTVIQPGEVFSFNETVGQRTVEKGYQSAIVYVDGKSESQTGGGICQVASTIYYCCLYAEMEIVAREPHMYVVSYVPGGMDATVYWGSLDYQFRNNTYFPIKINAYLSGGRCCIELVGTDIYHHQVEMESVCLSSTAYHVYRYVYDADGNFLKEEDLGTSYYQTHRS